MLYLSNRGFTPTQTQLLTLIIRLYLFITQLLTLIIRVNNCVRVGVKPFLYTNYLIIIILTNI